MREWDEVSESRAKFFAQKRKERENMEKYYIICNMDGDTNVEEITKEELLKRLQPDEDGNLYYGCHEFMSKITQTDTNYWGDDLLIIKGSIVTPKPIEVVTKYEI